MLRDNADFETGRFEDDMPSGWDLPSASGEGRVPVLAIDLGSRKVRAAAGFVTANGKVDMIGVKETDSTGITKGVITDPEVTVDAIRAALDELSLFLGSGVGKVFVSLSGNHIKRFSFGSSFVRNDSGRAVTATEIEGYVAQTLQQVEIAPGERIVHFYPQAYILDDSHHPDAPIGLVGEELEIDLQVMTAQASIIQNVTNCLNKAGLEIAGFIPGYLASCDAVLSTADKANGVALVELGSSSTQVVIFSKGLLKYSAVIPFGSGAITEDVKDGLHILKKEAELLKVKAGSALADKVKSNEFSTIRMKEDPVEISVKNLARIIQARAEEILEMVMLEIRNSGLERNLDNGIVLTGGGAQLRHLEALVNRATGYPARIGYPVERLAGGIDMEMRTPAFAASVGLIFNGHLRNTGLVQGAKDGVFKY